MEAKIIKATAFEAKNGNAFASFTVKTDEDTPRVLQHSVNPDNLTLGFEADIISVDAISSAGVDGLEMILKAAIGLKCEIEVDDDDNVEYFSTTIPSERVAYVEKALDKFIARG